MADVDMSAMKREPMLNVINIEDALPIVNEDLLEMLARLIEEASAGTIKRIGFAIVNNDHSISVSYSEGDGTDGLFLVAAVARLAHRLQLTCDNG